MQETLLGFFKVQRQRLCLGTNRDECGKGTQCQQRAQPATRGYWHGVSFHSWQARCREYRAPYRLIQPWIVCCCPLGRYSMPALVCPFLLPRALSVTLKWGER